MEAQTELKEIECWARWIPPPSTGCQLFSIKFVITTICGANTSIHLQLVVLPPIDRDKWFNAALKILIVRFGLVCSTWRVNSHTRLAHYSVGCVIDYKWQLPDVMSSWRHNTNGQSSSVYVVTSRPTHEALSKQHPTVMPGHVTFCFHKPAPYWCFTKIASPSQLDITAWLEKMLHLREINGIFFFFFSYQNVVICAHPHWASTR